MFFFRINFILITYLLLNEGYALDIRLLIGPDGEEVTLGPLDIVCGVRRRNDVDLQAQQDQQADNILQGNYFKNYLKEGHEVLTLHTRPRESLAEAKQPRNEVKTTKVPTKIWTTMAMCSKVPGVELFSSYIDRAMRVTPISCQQKFH